MSNGRGNWDKYITVFSPEGMLYQVEYAFKATKYPGLTTIGIRGKDCAFVLAQKKVPDRLMKPESITSMYLINEEIGACVTGRAPDGRALINRTRQEATEYAYNYGLPIPVPELAKRMGDIAQVNTQQAGMRPMGVSMLLVGMDTDDDGTTAPVLYKVDPAGYFVGYFATASGAKEVEGMAYLEKKQKSTPLDTLTRDECAMTALAALQHVTGTALKAKDVEMRCVSTAQPNFHVVPDKEIENWLTSIAERD